MVVWPGHQFSRMFLMENMNCYLSFWHASVHFTCLEAMPVLRDNCDGRQLDRHTLFCTSIFPEEASEPVSISEHFKKRFLASWLLSFAGWRLLFPFKSALATALFCLCLGQQFAARFGGLDRVTLTGMKTMIQCRPSRQATINAMVIYAV